MYLSSLVIFSVLVINALAIDAGDRRTFTATATDLCACSNFTLNVDAKCENREEYLKMEPTKVSKTDEYCEYMKTAHDKVKPKKSTKEEEDKNKPKALTKVKDDKDKLKTKGDNKNKTVSLSEEQDQTRNTTVSTNSIDYLGCLCVNHKNSTAGHTRNSLKCTISQKTINYYKPSLKAEKMFQSFCEKLTWEDLKPTPIVKKQLGINNGKPCGSRPVLDSIEFNTKLDGNTTQDTEPTPKPTTQDTEPTSKPTTQDTEPTSKPTTQDTEPTPKPTTQDTEPISKPTTHDTEPTPKPTTQDTEPTSKPTTQDTEPTPKPTTQDTENKPKPTTQDTETKPKPTTQDTEPKPEPTTEKNNSDSATTPTLIPEPNSLTAPVPDAAHYYSLGTVLGITFSAFACGTVAAIAANMSYTRYKRRTYVNQVGA